MEENGQQQQRQASRARGTVQLLTRLRVSLLGCSKATLAEQERDVLQSRVAELEAAAFFARSRSASPTPPAVVAVSPAPAAAAAAAAPRTPLPPLGSPLALKASASFKPKPPLQENAACQTIQLMEDEETQTENSEEVREGALGAAAAARPRGCLELRAHARSLDLLALLCSAVLYKL